MPIYGSIVILNVNGTDGSKYTLNANSCLFGSQSNCDVRIQKSNVAPEHCIIEVQPDGSIVLKNLTKRNGQPIKVNNREVQDLALLNDHDVFEVGEIKFRWETLDTVAGGSTTDLISGRPGVINDLPEQKSGFQPMSGFKLQEFMQTQEAADPISDDIMNQMTAFLDTDQPSLPTVHSSTVILEQSAIQYSQHVNKEGEGPHTKVAPIDDLIDSVSALKSSPQKPSYRIDSSCGSPKQYESLSTLLIKTLNGKPVTYTSPDPNMVKVTKNGTNFEETFHEAKTATSFNHFQSISQSATREVTKPSRASKGIGKKTKPVGVTKPSRASKGTGKKTKPVLKKKRKLRRPLSTRKRSSPSPTTVRQMTTTTVMVSSSTSIVQPLKPLGILFCGPEEEMAGKKPRSKKKTESSSRPLDMFFGGPEEEMVGKKPRSKKKTKSSSSPLDIFFGGPEEEMVEQQPMSKARTRASSKPLNISFGRPKPPPAKRSRRLSTTSKRRTTSKGPLSSSLRRGLVSEPTTRRRSQRPEYCD